MTTEPVRNVRVSWIASSPIGWAEVQAVVYVIGGAIGTLGGIWIAGLFR